MKKLFLGLLILFFLTGCKHEEIILEEEIINLYIGEAYNLQVNFSSNKKQDIILSTDNDILYFEDTTIHPFKLGTAKVTVALKKNPIIKAQITVNVIDSLEIETATGCNFIYKGNFVQLIAIDKADKDGLGVTWSVDNEYLALISQDGFIKGYHPGIVTVTATSKTNFHKKSITLEIIEIDPENIIIETPKKEIYLNEEITLTAKIFPEEAIQDVIWESSNPEIATIDYQGNLKGLKSGVVTIYASAKEDKTITTAMEINVKVDPIKLIESLHVERPFIKEVTTYGNSEKKEMVYSSVSKYFNDDLNLIEKIVPISNPQYQEIKATKGLLEMVEKLKLIRTGIIHEETKYITYHDTGNNNLGANAFMHAQFIESEYNIIHNRARSWHYTVDDKSVYHHIPDNEVTWQGDSYEAYAKSIGIETCVDEGSDLYATWQRTAKLIARLLVKHNLSIANVKQHYDFSGKNCPQTLRRNALYSHAIELVTAEYLVVTELKDYQIKFTSLNREFVDNRGRVIKLPLIETKVGYQVHITNNKDYDETITLYSIIPGIK